MVVKRRVIVHENQNFNTLSIQQSDKDYFFHPWTDFSSFYEDGCHVITRGEGFHVFDSDGKKYIDGLAGIWCVNIGHGNTEMVDAIADQLKRLAYYATFFHLTNPVAVGLAAKLAEIAPSHLNHSFFENGGSMANETAIRMVHFYWNRRGQPSKRHIISRVNSYHGSTFLTGTLTGILEDHDGFTMLDGMIHYVSSPYVYRRPDGVTTEEFCTTLVQELEDKINELGPENVACYIAEPIQGAGGVIVPPDGYHRRCEAICRKYDVLYIADEVITGFGRLGHFFTSEDMFDTKPDIITTAKAISSAYMPLSATLISDEIHEVLKQPRAPGQLLTHGFTYSGHPGCCAAGLKNIEILARDRILENVLDLGPVFSDLMAKELGGLPIVGDVRGVHFVQCIEIVADRTTKEIFAPEVRVGDRVTGHCRARGLLARPLGHLVVLSPPLILTRDVIAEMVQILRDSVKATMDDLLREGLWKG